jgi:hypothetical protein
MTNAVQLIGDPTVETGKQGNRKLAAKLRHESEPLKLQHGKRLDLDATLK